MLSFLFSSLPVSRHCLTSTSLLVFLPCVAAGVFHYTSKLGGGGGGVYRQIVLASLSYTEDLSLIHKFLYKIDNNLWHSVKLYRRIGKTV